MSGSSNLNSFRDRGQVAVQLVSCGVLLPGLVQDCTQHSCVIAIKFTIVNLCFEYVFSFILENLFFFPKVNKIIYHYELH